jgi:hypothetical protein
LSRRVAGCSAARDKTATAGGLAPCRCRSTIFSIASTTSENEPPPLAASALMQTMLQCLQTPDVDPAARPSVESCNTVHTGPTPVRNCTSSSFRRQTDCCRVRNTWSSGVSSLRWRHGDTPHCRAGTYPPRESRVRCRQPLTRRSMSFSRSCDRQILRACHGNPCR